MSIVPVVFLGTPQFACESLKALVEDEHFDVVGVVTQPDRPAGRKMKLQASPVKKLAQSYNLPVISPESVNSKDSLKQLKSWRAEAAVVVAFGQLMSESFLNLYPQKVVNIHASLLPRWRGAAPIQRAIMEGDKETGVALQVMVKKLDAGDILGERTVAITEEMDSIDLHNLLMSKATELLHIEFMDYLRGNLIPKPQNQELVTYASKLTKEESLIDWKLPAIKISQRIRGLKMGPGSYSILNGKKLKFHKVKSVDSFTETQDSGRIVAIAKDHFTVSCGVGCLEVLEVQPESKSKMLVSEFLKGSNIENGMIFGA